MDRRKFLGSSIKACASSVILGNFGSKALAHSNLLQAIAQAECEDRVLVLVQLNGGNDGLNTVIPLDQYDLLSQARSNVLIPENQVLPLSRYNATGFHPSGSGFHELFESNKFSIVQGCSYENPDFSHFRATDIWLTGSDSNEFLNTGWMGRDLEEVYPEFPDGFPSDQHPDPVAIQMGSVTSLALQGSSANFGVAITNISDEYASLNSYSGAAPENRAGCELDYIRRVASDTERYNIRIREAANNQSSNMSSKYADNRLARQFQNVARLIKGGLQTKVYIVSHSGYDTHALQTEDNSTTEGTHASLIQTLSDAVNAFQDDLELMEINERVTGMIFSEFGRRVASNGSNGTDHGTAMPVMLFGTELIGDMYGTNPDLLDPDSGSYVSNIPMQRDYRSVYYSVLKDWFCMSEAELSSIFSGEEYEYVELFKPGLVTGHPADRFKEERKNSIKALYPQPMDSYTNVSFTTSGGTVRLDLYEASGVFVKTLMDKNINPGPHEFKIERGNLKSGMYLLKMQCNDFTESKKLILK